MSTERSADATPDGEAPAAPAVFRTPRSALVAVVFLALCLSPIAFQGGPWFLLFLGPAAVAVWVLWPRTVVDTDGVAVRSWRGTTRWPWSRVGGLRLVDRGWVRAVEAGSPDGSPDGSGDGPARELELRGVRVRDLAKVGAASGGRIDVPTPGEAAAAADHRRELAAARMRVAKLRESQEPQQAAEPPEPEVQESEVPESGTPGTEARDGTDETADRHGA